LRRLSKSTDAGVFPPILLESEDTRSDTTFMGPDAFHFPCLDTLAGYGTCSFASGHLVPSRVKPTDVCPQLKK
jgi:hypothetical protein